MTPETLWQDAQTGRQLTRADRPSADTLALLQATVWGSRASRYRILDVDDKLARLRAPSFFVLSENGAELAVFVLDRCTKRVAGRDCDAFHFAMAATVPARRNEGLAGLMIGHIRDWCVAKLRPPGFGFAYVEASTEFSLRLSDSIGYAVEAEIPLTLFTRLAPRNRGGVRRLEAGEVPWLAEVLAQLYTGHELADFDRSIRAYDYHVLSEGGQVLAGAQAEILRWSVVEMPGLAGWALLTLWPRLPGARRLLNLADLPILRLGNLYVPEGHERHLERLLEALLARHGARIGLIMLDRRSPVLRRLRKGLRRGLLSGALRGSAKLRIDGVGLGDEIGAALSAHPLMVSPADVL